MTENKFSPEEYRQAPLTLSDSNEGSLPHQNGNPSLPIQPRTEEERALDLYDDQGIRTKSLPASRLPEPAKSVVNNVPSTFSPLPIPDPRNRRTERAPWWRGPRKKSVKGVRNGK